METIGVIFILTSMLGWLAGIVGLYRPSLLANKKTGDTPSRKKIIFGMAGLLLLFTLGGAMLPEPKRESKTENQIGAKTEKHDAPKLNIALIDWIERMNAQLKDVDRPALTVSTEKNKCDVWCTSTYESGKSVAYLVSHRDGRIHEITMIAAGDGTAQSGGQIMLGLLSMTHVLSSEVSKSDISKFTMTLLKEALENGKAEQSIGSVKYNASKIDGMGLFFSASK